MRNQVLYTFNSFLSKKAEFFVLILKNKLVNFLQYSTYLHFDISKVCVLRVWKGCVFLLPNLNTCCQCRRSLTNNAGVSDKFLTIASGPPTWFIWPLEAYTSHSNSQKPVCLFCRHKCCHSHIATYCNLNWPARGFIFLL